MNLKMILLQGLARIILGNDVFSTIKDIVKVVNNILENINE